MGDPVDDEHEEEGLMLGRGVSNNNLHVELEESIFEYSQPENLTELRPYME